jgi:hypothetical protein
MNPRYRIRKFSHYGNHQTVAERNSFVEIVRAANVHKWSGNYFIYDTESGDTMEINHAIDLHRRNISIDDLIAWGYVTKEFITGQNVKRYR